jgi:hypothetical protein
VTFKNIRNPREFSGIYKIFMFDLLLSLLLLLFLYVHIKEGEEGSIQNNNHYFMKYGPYSIKLSIGAV